MQRKFLATALAALLVTPGAWALDLAQAYDAAVKYDATYASAKAALVAARERNIQADALTLPTVGLSGGASLNRVESKTGPTPNLTANYNSTSLGISGSMPLYRPGNIASQSQARAAEKIAQATFVAARQDLVTRVAQAYFDVLASQDSLLSIQVQKKAVSEQLAQAKREFEVGTKTIVDTNEAQARYDQIIALEAVAQSDLSIKRSALAQLTGVETDTLNGLVAKPTLQLPQPAKIEEWLTAAEQGNPSVVIYGYNLEIASKDIERNKAGGMPTLDLVSTIGANHASNGVGTGGYGTTGKSASIGVQLNWPLYAGGSINAKIREAIANEDKARSDLDGAKRAATQGARQSYLGVQFGIAQVKALEAAEVSANTQLSSTKLGYQVGVRINLDVLNAEQQLANTRRDLAKARYDTLMAGLRLKSAAGTLTEDDLKAVNAYLAK